MKLAAFSARVLVLIVILLLLFSLGWGLAHVKTVGKMLALACLWAYLVNPLVKRLQSRGLGRSMAIAAVFLALFTGVATTCFLLAPVVQQQLAKISGEVEQVVASSQTHIARLQVILNETLPGAFMEGRDLNAEFHAAFDAWSAQVVGATTDLVVGLAANAIYIVLLPMVTFFLLLDGPAFFSALIDAVPNRYFEVVHRLITRIDDQLGGYIRGVLVVTVCVGVVSTAGLWLCGMDYFFVVGPLNGLLNIIPIFGPMVGMGVSGLAMILQTGEPASALGPILVGAGAQVMDNIAFTPIALSRSVDLHPLLVLVMTLLGGEMFGLLGLLLAVPVTATVKVVGQAVREAVQGHRLAATARR